ncbi:hypothetical protein K2173_017330 [Erythroxylum novogranatense]|uniref:Uncharacterized protein n=1 Tax=Erythroxylum novogranatense TaxID=1862640 RepID=A0AAV8TK79_9ROSI|nr:hypothetical protein K2173_017330 [Erythroxylum novogranatense]
MVYSMNSEFFGKLGGVSNLQGSGRRVIQSSVVQTEPHAPPSGPSVTEEPTPVSTAQAQALGSVEGPPGSPSVGRDSASGPLQLAPTLIPPNPQLRITIWRLKSSRIRKWYATKLFCLPRFRTIPNLLLSWKGLRVTGLTPGKEERPYSRPLPFYQI